jgi:Ca-activated chloride channel family protein
VEIDEQTLVQVAEATGGQYFRATDEKSLRAIYDEIEDLEKRKMVDKHYQSEPPATPGSFLNWAFLILTIILVTEFGLFVSNE